MKKKKKKCPDCSLCANCVYVGEGGYLCDMKQTIVIEDFEPTPDYMACDGKEFVAE